MSLEHAKILELVAKSRLDVTHKFEVPPICIEIINDEENETSIFGTFGNFSTVIASPKVGKTTLVAVPVAAYLNQGNLSGFIAHVSQGKEKVLWIDTEQGKNEALTTIKTICSFAGLGHEKHPINLDYITLRQFGYETRVQLIDYLVNNTPNLGLVIIDGIRDCINSINDEREATFIAGKLLKWSEERNIHIITILHQNKGDGNARGHLGTELMNKAETVINLSKEYSANERQTKVESKYNRHKEFSDFAITIRNNQPIMIGVSGYLPEKPKVNQLTNIQKTSIVNAVFTNETFLPYSKLWQSIKKQLADVCSINFGDNKCKELVTLLVDERYLYYEQNLKHYQKNV